MPKKTFTDKERELIRLLDNVNYVVRTEYGHLYGFYAVPVRGIHGWYDGGPGWELNSTTLSFESITWQDEPVSRAEILEEDE